MIAPFRRRLFAAALPLLLGGCLFSVGPPPRSSLRSTEQEVFWRRLSQLCGRTFEGRMAEGTDQTFVRNRLLIHVRQCSPAEVRIGFVIGPDSSRSWIVRRVDGALALTHDVPGGEATGYGGVTRTAGTPERQDFAADSATAQMLPPAASNVWSLEILDGDTFAYTVARPGVRQRFRLEFDLRRPVS
ncbi:MAG TPA: hypothetical protein VF092_15255 [Longimicrobium sp.]